MHTFPRSVVLGAVLASLAAGTGRGAAVVTADFSKGADFPLIKSKFNLYNTAIPSTADFERDNTLLYELNVESIRIEQHWGFGQSLSRTVGGTADDLTYDWTLPDHWQRLVNSTGALFFWAYNYTPYPLAAQAQTPPPAEPWAEVVRATATHLRQTRLPVLYHEVWNEPDLGGGVFFTGTQADYNKLYGNTVTNIRAINPDAKVGGPAVAGTYWNQGFVDYVNASNLPLDFFSFHNYGTTGIDSLHKAAAAVAKYPHFRTTELVLGEYNTYTRWLAGDKQDTYVGATDMLHSFLEFLKHPELTSVNWAQFQDPCACGWGGGTPDQYLGLITLDGHRKATFNAMRIYGRMPPDRCEVAVTGPGVEAAASADSHRAGVLILNRTGQNQDVTVTLKNVPFERATIRLYPIDSKHNSYLDGANEALAPSAVFTAVNPSGWSHTLRVPNNGTLYVEAEDGLDAQDAPPNQVAQVIRVNRYYPSRTATSYSDFDQRTWVARQGMGSIRAAEQQVGATVEGLPELLRIRGRLEGTLARYDANSLVGVRLDFHNGVRYTRGVLFVGPFSGQPEMYDPARTGTYAFGTRRAPDRVSRVPDLSAFTLRIADYAPRDWNGRADLTFMLQNAGGYVRVRWQVTGESTRVFTANCGDEGALPPYNADTGFSGSGMSTRTVETPVNTATAASPAPPAVYRSERTTSSEMTYTVPDLVPGRLYKVRLHFAETFWSDTRQRLFDVWVNDRQMLDRFDVTAAAGGVYRAVVREFVVPAESTGRIRIRFRSVKESALINAIEVLGTAGSPTPPAQMARRACALSAGLTTPDEGEALSLDVNTNDLSAGRVDVADALDLLQAG